MDSQQRNVWLRLEEDISEISPSGGLDRSVSAFPLPVAAARPGVQPEQPLAVDGTHRPHCATSLLQP